LGTTVTNVHVQNRSEATVRLVLDALTQHAAHIEMFPVEHADRADRSIVVVPDDEWVSIYDQDALQQHQLDILAGLTSRATGGAALAVQVYDSDVFIVKLFMDGVLVDGHNSHPGFGGKPITAEGARAAGGHPSSWKSLVSDSWAVADLRACWADRPLFADDTAIRTAEILGCDPAAWVQKFRDFEYFAPKDAVRLHFRSRKRPAWERELRGPARLVSSQLSTQPIRRIVGKPLQLISNVRNAGGAGKGLSLAIWGSALRDGLIEIDELTVAVGRGENRADGTTRRPFRVDGDDQAIYRASLPQQVIPAGVAESAVQANLLKALSAMRGRHIQVCASGRVVKKGRGTVTVGFRVGDSQTNVATKLIVDAPLSRTPRVQRDRWPRPPAIAGSGILVAMVIADSPREYIVEVARDTFVRLDTLRDPTSAFHAAIHSGARLQRPREWKAKGAGFLSGKRWTELDNDMCEAQLVELRADGHGMMVGGAYRPLSAPIDPELETVCWWVRVSGWPIKRIAATTAILTGAIDDIMESELGVQAFVTRQGRAPETLDGTHYESAAGFHGEVTTLTSWATRWLRSLGTEAMWMDASLRERLDTKAEAAIARVADVCELGTALRICLRRQEDLPALESAVAVLLPSKADHGTAIRRAMTRPESMPLDTFEE